MLAAALLGRIGFRMVSSYPLPEGFTEFDVFSLGSCLLVEGERACVRVCLSPCACVFCHFCAGIEPNAASLRGVHPLH